MSFFKKIFTKKERKEEQQSQPKTRSDLNTTKPNKIAEQVTKSGEKRNSVWIEQMIGPENVRVKEKFEIIAKGQFSDLAWELAETKATVQEKEITITVIGKRKVDVFAGQTTKPFQINVEVEGLQKGIYTVKPARGKAKQLIIKVE